MNTSETASSGVMATLGSVNLHQVNLDQVNLNQEDVQAIRHCLHELANVFTGVMIAGDLLSLHLVQGPLQHYAAEICVCSERGSVLVREIRRQLLAACGEAEAAPYGPRPSLDSENARDSATKDLT